MLACINAIKNFGEKMKRSNVDQLCSSEKNAKEIAKAYDEKKSRPKELENWFNQLIKLPKT